MTKRYYFDTSIWLDFFENRDEPNMPKGKFAKDLVEKVVNENRNIVCSNAIKDELISLGYSYYEVEDLFKPLNPILIFVEFNEKQFGKAKDLSAKRDVPLLDALHALIARDSKALIITRDPHFKKLIDITKYKKPEDVI